MNATKAASALERVESALREAGCTERSGNWSCPAHEDNEPSLHVTSDRRGVAMKCHANCDIRDILSVLGLEWGDLFAEPMKEVARYPYQNNGQLFEKVRFQAEGKKTFRWEPALNGHRMPLYRLEEALALPDPVTLHESEKSVDALLDMKISATCMPGGAGDWHAEYSDSLRGREIVIVCDRDDAGVKHGMKVHAALQGKAASIKLVQSKTLNDHDDIEDHLAAGWGMDELVPMRPENQIADRYIPIDWRTAWKEEAAQVRWLVEPVLEEGTLCALYGRPGDGKSLVTLWLCLQIVRSGGTVLMADDENTRTDLVSRLKAFGASPDELDNLIVLNFASLPPLDTPEGGMHLAALADKYTPKMITLDTISRMVEGEENSASTYLQLYRNSMTPLKARGICVLRIDHAGKDTGRGQRGSSAKSGDVDVVWRLSRESEDFLVLEREKSRNGHGEPTVVLQKLEEPCLRFEWDACSLVDGQVMEIAKRLDRYGADLNCTRESAEALLHEYNVGARHSKVSAALKYRRDQSRNGGQGTGDKDQAKQGWSPSKYVGVDEDGCPF